MVIDLHSIPFSRCGAFLAFSYLSAADGFAPGLYLRSVHGGAPDSGRLARLDLLVDGQPAPFETMTCPVELEMQNPRGSLRLCLAEPAVLRVRGEMVGLRLTFNALPRGDYAIPSAHGRCLVNVPLQSFQAMFVPLLGSWHIDAPWTGTGDSRLVVDLLPDAETSACEGVLEEIFGVWRARDYKETYPECVAAVQGEFDDWLDSAPALPEEYTEARRMAVYVNWSSMVEPVGHFLRPSMLMSKNWMTNTWSWDHCFNAMALIYDKPITAWDQLMTIFDQQDEHGGLPDFFNDRTLSWNFCKPPIHGWALGWMMRHSAAIRKDQINQIYGPLCRWTEWWFQYRDDDQDGVPQYHHGNDSGWDNATPFLIGLPLEAPDLCAYLVLQMETLARLAALLNNQEESESWQRRSEELLNTLLAHFWQGDHFVALRSGDHMVADTESLFLYLPMILGKRLPADVRHELVNGLTRPGRYLTPFGLATESPQSTYYLPDGYWRGPIWAPSTLMLVEGLSACGEHTLARKLARQFCDMVMQAGFAENFDALTGIGLRDRAYTWTSSVFLLLGHEYLLDEAAH